MLESSATCGLFLCHGVKWLEYKGGLSNVSALNMAWWCMFRLAISLEKPVTSGFQGHDTAGTWDSASLGSGWALCIVLLPSAGPASSLQPSVHMLASLACVQTVPRPAPPSAPSAYTLVLLAYAQRILTGEDLAGQECPVLECPPLVPPACGVTTYGSPMYVSKLCNWARRVEPLVGRATVMPEHIIWRLFEITRSGETLTS